MITLLRSRIAYLSTSFALFLVALPLISIGTTSGPRFLLWMGLAALGIGALIPPVQRLCCAPDEPASKDDNGNEEMKPKKGSQ